MANLLGQIVRKLRIYTPARTLKIRLDRLNPAFARHQRQMTAFYAQFVGPGSLVFDIGANLGNRSEIASHGIDYQMAVALGSHITFWTDIDTALTSAQRAEVKRWTDFYKANRADIATFTYPLLGDPVANAWAALQPWNPDTGRGFLLAYRQGAVNATQTIALRGVRGSGAFALTLVDPATGVSTSLGTVAASALRAGLDVTVDHPYGYALIRIEPA